ncbi:hypothetical protein LCGC14_2273950 [marine sediment metagenome]|uniref:Uncharacterized protein n=1 Tax=marine sediment metagenome TaxID=412755 RepID=A0A0F9F8P1_9ZZZZ
MEVNVIEGNRVVHRTKGGKMGDWRGIAWLAAAVMVASIAGCEAMQTKYYETTIQKAIENDYIQTGWGSFKKYEKVKEEVKNEK